MAAARQPKPRAIPARPNPAGLSLVRRSAVTNGARLFVEGGDETSAWSRRFSDIMTLRLDDLGDSTTLSENQISLSRRASALECQLEALEAVMSTGVDVDLSKYAQAAGTLARLLEKLGLKRVPREAMDLKSYIAAHARETAA